MTSFGTVGVVYYFCIVLAKVPVFWKNILLEDETMVWLSFLAVLAISDSKLYKKENKTGTDGIWNWGERKFICFSFIPIREDLQNWWWTVSIYWLWECALFGECVSSSTFLSVSEMKTFFSQMQVFFLY